MNDYYLALECLRQYASNDDEDGDGGVVRSAASSVLDSLVEEGNGSIDLAAERGLSHQLYILGRQRESTKQSLPDEVAYLLMFASAKAGHTLAAFECGLMLANGDGVRRDDGAAEKFFLSAAAKGHAEANTKARILHSRRTTHLFFMVCSAVSVGALSTCVFVGFLQYGASQPPTHAVDSGGTIMADDYLSNW